MSIREDFDGLTGTIIVLYHHVHMKPKGFEWDSGNLDKNRKKHAVTEKECEDIFSDATLVTNVDIKHLQVEKRFTAHGKTQHGRLLYVVFTIRSNTIRVISARDQSRKERRFYEEKNKTK